MSCSLSLYLKPCNNSRAPDWTPSSSKEKTIKSANIYIMAFVKSPGCSHQHRKHSKSAILRMLKCYNRGCGRLAGCGPQVLLSFKYLKILSVNLYLALSPFKSASSTAHHHHRALQEAFMVQIGCKCGPLRRQMPVALPVQLVYTIDWHLCMYSCCCCATKKWQLFWKWHSAIWAEREAARIEIILVIMCWP